MWWRDTARYWDLLGAQNPFGVILTGADRLPRAWDIGAFFETGVADVACVMAELDRLAPQLGRQSALDFGCGLGRISRALAAHFDRVVGLDVSRSMIAQAQRLNAGHAKCSFAINRSARLRGVASDRFDFVYCRLVLQHIPPRNVQRYIRELVRVLAPGGILLFQLPEPLEQDPDVLFSAEERAFVDAPNAATALKRLTPRIIIRAYRHLRFRQIVKREGRVPRMYMFGLPRLAVLDLLAQTAAARVIRVDADQSHGDEVAGWAYYVTK